MEEYRWCTDQLMKFSGAADRDLLVADGGDAALLLHSGEELEAQLVKDSVMRAAGAVMGGRRALVCGYGDAGKIAPPRRAVVAPAC